MWNVTCSSRRSPFIPRAAKAWMKPRLWRNTKEPIRIRRRSTRCARLGSNFYGPLKALSEKEAEKWFPGKTLVVRPGLIVGPGDQTDRFTYWPVRLERGGEVLAPGQPSDPVQFIDARIWLNGRSEWRRIARPEFTTPPARPSRSRLAACLRNQDRLKFESRFHLGQRRVPQTAKGRGLVGHAGLDRSRAAWLGPASVARWTKV